jgi:hypothetical protein
MTSGKQSVKSGAAARDPYHAYRRRVQKDTLLADNPPAALGVGLIIVAVVLAAAVGSLHWVEYQESVPLSITLKTADGGHAAYGEAYLRPQEMARVCTGQVVLIDWGGHLAPQAASAQATVGEIRTVSENALYGVRVELPTGSVEGSWIGPAPPHGTLLQGKILTQKQTLLDKLFGFFRMIAQSI